MFLNILYQLNQHLGIGIRNEMHTFLLELLLQLGIVLDNTVMDDGQILAF